MPRKLALLVPILGALAVAPVPLHSAAAAPKASKKKKKQNHKSPPKIPPSAKQGPQCGTVRVDLDGFTYQLSRASGRLDTALEDTARVRTELELELTHSKRRVFQNVLVRMVGHRSDGGQIMLEDRSRVGQVLSIPEGCEIASITQTRGSVRDEAPPQTQGDFEVPGTGLIPTATCRIRGVASCRLDLPPIEVGLQPAKVECEPVTLDPQHLAIGAWNHHRGDADLEGARVHLTLTTALESVRQGEAVQIDTWMNAQQQGGDESEFRGHAKAELFDARHDAPGCRVKSFAPQRGRIWVTTQPGSDGAPAIYGAGLNLGRAEGMLKTAWCTTDTPGVDHQQLHCVNIDVAAFEIQLEREIPVGPKKSKSKSKMTKKMRKKRRK